jgi:integrase
MIMPRYRQKITNLLDYAAFKEAISEMNQRNQAFLSVLFFAGCRVSEALALMERDIHCTKDTIFVQFYRLKGSKQTDPQELPRADALHWLCGQEGRLFPFSRTTAYRLVKRVFPALYPHYFRMNRITKTDILFGDATVYHVFGISASSIDHYRGKVDVKRVGAALKDELK